MKTNADIHSIIVVKLHNEILPLDHDYCC